MSDMTMTAERYWALPENVRKTAEEMVVFYGGCSIWYETDDDEYGGALNGLHLAPLGCTVDPLYAPDYKDLGKITRATLPDMWAYRLNRTQQSQGQTAPGSTSCESPLLAL